MRRWRVAGYGLVLGLWSSAASADQVASCAGALLAGAAYLACSHTVPSAPTQLCTYSWSLQTDAGLRTFQGFFSLLPGQMNRVVFQTGDVTAQIGGSIVICQNALWERPPGEQPQAAHP